MKKAIKCPDHKDRHASAVIFTRPDGSEWLHCKGCKANRLYKSSDKKAENMQEEQEYNVEDYGVDVRTCVDHIELLEMFEQEKGITPDMINNMGGFPTDEGYLGFKYGKGREVYRNLNPESSKPRFINVGSQKGLMGDDLLQDWDEIYLVEGLTDYLSFRYEINTNVVTSFGAELSEEQAYLLRGKTTFILFDRDFAGYKGAKQAEKRIEEFGGTPIIIELPDGLDLKTNGKKVDVNYLVHKEKETFKEWLKNKTQKYKVTDSSYLDVFKKRVPLKYYETDIPKIKVTEGLYVVSGLPGVGKTTLGISLVDHFVRQGGSVLYCNYDLPKDQIISRLASRYTKKYSWSELEGNPVIISEEPQAESQLKQCLEHTKIMNKLTISEIRHCKKYYTHIIVDYLQRIPNYNPDQRVGLEKIMDELSDMASNEGMTVVAISRQSLNGNPFSGTSAIEYHAQAASILTKTDNDNGIISCETIKNTRGEIGTTLFKVDYAHQRLTPIKLNDIAAIKLKELDSWGDKL